MTLRSSLSSHAAKSLASEEDLERLRRAAWRREGVLNVHEEDGRLSWSERELVRQLGTKLYGKRQDGRQSVSLRGVPVRIRQRAPTFSVS